MPCFMARDYRRLHDPALYLMTDDDAEDREILKLARIHFGAVKTIHVEQVSQPENLKPASPIPLVLKRWPRNRGTVTVTLHYVPPAL